MFIREKEDVTTYEFEVGEQDYGEAQRLEKVRTYRFASSAREVEGRGPGCGSSQDKTRLML